MSDDAWLPDERVAELLKEAKVKGDEFDPLLLAALLEIRQRRSWGRTPAPPPRQAQSSERLLEWAKTALEHDIQNLYDDPYGLGYAEGQSPELAVLEEWEVLEGVAGELGLDITEVAARCAHGYERDRMEKILASARWAKAQTEPNEPEELEAL